MLSCLRLCRNGCASFYPTPTSRLLPRLLESDAPKTCRSIWEALPFEGVLNHGIWSGPETYLMIDPSIRIAPENQTVQTQAGEIGYYTVEGGRIVDWPDDISELAFFYGRGARPRMPTGPVAVNLFARVTENLEGSRVHVTRFAARASRHCG